MINTKKIRIFTLIAFVIANIFSYCLFHIPTLVLEERIEWLEYTRVFVNKFLEFITPSLGAAVLFLGWQDGGIKKALLRALALSLPRMIYLLPYYYVYYIVNFYDSAESISLSLLVSVFGTALLFGYMLLLSYLMRVMSRVPFIKEMKEYLPLNQRERMPKDVKRTLIVKSEQRVFAEMKVGGVFNFGQAECLGIFASVFATFIIELVREMTDSISFIIEYSGDLYPDEIIYIVVCYVFLLAELLAGQAICASVKNIAVKSTYGSISDKKIITEEKED